MSSLGVVCGVGLEELEHLVLSVHTPKCCYADLGVMVLVYLYDKLGSTLFYSEIIFLLN